MQNNMRYMLLLLTSLIAPLCFAQDKADFVIVNKSDRELMLFTKGVLLKTYHVSLGGDPEGHKAQEGDNKTPEGRYVLDLKNPDSSFHKSIRVSYPSQQDKEAARKLGVSPGGQIMIHGQRNGFGWLGSVAQYFNWTAGFIAVKNSEMEEIWSMVDVGTQIEINP